MARLKISQSKPVVPIVWVADVGSIKQEHFAWWRVDLAQCDDHHERDKKDIGLFAKGIADDLSSGASVALGFECPLFVPVTEDPKDLTSPRDDAERQRPWSAGAGCAVLATGLSECVWVFNRIRVQAEVKVQPSLCYDDFITRKANLFVWEAFVTSAAKGSSHEDDAKAAAYSFCKKWPKILEADLIKTNKPWYSLVGAALLRSGLTDDISILSQKCVVVKSKT